MLKLVKSVVLALCLPVLSFGSASLAAEETVAEEERIAEITVNARRVANTRPAGTYASPATLLRFDPFTQLQSRGMAEGQSDVVCQ